MTTYPSSRPGPKISVIVPFYNAAQTLASAVTSIVGQTYRNLEIILIDDGSIDDSLKLLKTLKMRQWPD